jgi:AcrR family transcriptional regulator
VNAPLPAEERQPRKQSRDTRRQQLILSTIAVIAERGYSRTTMSDVARHAGLSHGLVNFHFENKDRLLSETLMFLSREYRDNWVAALEAAPKDPAHQLDALIRADFNEAICTPDRLSAWCSFWGEAQCRPLYQQECGANDEEYAERLNAICRDLAALEGSPLVAERAARVLRVTMEGVWLELMTMTSPYSRDEAMITVFTCAAAFFPKSFTDQGLRAGWL